ncbi:MAG: hypothetical protein HKN26_17350 [Acidimicrobiales bacterium]|nr:hypothetical protein [Acidimicrobiales bacterium]
MTESPGPGWWLSAGGQWRPPEEHPDLRRPTGAPDDADGRPHSGPARPPDLGARATYLGPGVRMDLAAAGAGTLLAERPATPEPDVVAEPEVTEPEITEPEAGDTASALLPITLPDEDDTDLTDQPDEADFWANVRDEASAVAPPDAVPTEVERFDATGESVSPTQAPTPEPTDEPFPDDTGADRRGISLVSFLVLIALAAAGTAYYLYFIREPDTAAPPTTEQPANSVFALDVGSCVGTEPVALDQPLSVIDVVPCTEPHSAEVFDVANSPDGEFDATAIREFATKICAASLEELFGVAYEDAPVEFFLINPSEASWAANDRSSLCLAYTPNATLDVPLSELRDG